MHVGIITYQKGHLKTWQILKKILAKPFEISIYAFPFINRPLKKSFFEDRPYQLIDFDIEKFCQEHSVDYIKVGGWDDEYSSHLDIARSKKKPDVYLTCISKIIPKSFIGDRTIINAHPGLLPENRGVDAFKWSIINGWPIGVSLHTIDENIDSGVILCRMKVPVLGEDTLRDVADRAYDMECDLQANFDYYLDRGDSGEKICDKYPLSVKRIPRELDRNLEDIFQKQKDRLIELSTAEKPWPSHGRMI